MQSRVFILSVAFLLFVGVSAKSQIGVGYSVLSLNTSDSHDLKGFETRFRFPLHQAGEGPLASFVFSGGFYGGGDAFEDPVWDLSTGTFGLELASHHRLGSSGLFIRPGITGGGALAFYKSRVRRLSTLFEEDENAFGWMGQVGAVLGIEGQENIGVEVSYSLLGIDFNEEAEGTHEQFYIGLSVGF